MKNNRKEVQPKQLFKVLVNAPFSDVEKEILTFLYQPIVGAGAYSLFLTLLSEVRYSGLSEALFHRELILLLDMGSKQLEEARTKLEGIGLLDTFVKEDAELGFTYIYRLNRPETVESFFKDEILSLTLLNQVGEKKFNQLFERFQPQYIELDDYENVSSGFREAYSFREEQLITEAPRLQEIKSTFEDPVSKRDISVVDSTAFDWEFFLSQLEHFGLKLPENKDGLKEEIYLYNRLYGMDELEMLDFVKDSFDYHTNEINRRVLRQVIDRSYRENKQQKPSQVKRNDEVLLTEEEQRSYRFNSLKMDGFTEADIRSIIDSESIPPLKYLAAVQKQTGGFGTGQEERIVENLVRRSGLPNSVINILISYVLVIQKQPTLTSSYVNTIANDWAKKEIFSPEKAMTYLKEKQTENQKKRQNRSYSSNRNQQVVRKEKLPDWVDNPVPEEKLSREAQEKLDKEMEDFLRRRGER
ncbi:replication initiation and membrane attachment family protein [Enterococcus sp. BWR-S5]|uniref:replication initiation and membrane attachment family protein n=1 Tax=Enterococcus sp. BWR-S5 TaxID=2787714 RepID=UPI00192425F0|nr:DnaD domain protein [Enterococcus sp. BWR-S5]